LGKALRQNGVEPSLHPTGQNGGQNVHQKKSGKGKRVKTSQMKRRYDVKKKSKAQRAGREDMCSKDRKKKGRMSPKKGSKGGGKHLSRRDRARKEEGKKGG